MPSNRYAPFKNTKFEEPILLRGFLNIALLRNVQTVQELPNILVAHSADLLDICRTLGNILERVTEQLQLILLVFRRLDFDSWLHNDSADNLLTDEISDLNFIQASLIVLVHVDVDWEMGIDITHLVLETLRDTDDQVVDEGPDCSKRSDVLPCTVVQFDIDNILFGVGEVYCQMVEVLCKFASRSFDGD